MTTAQLAADFVKAIHLARFDARQGDTLWLTQLINLAEIRAIKFPAEAKIYRKAAKAAVRELKKLNSGVTTVL